MFKVPNYSSPDFISAAAKVLFLCIFAIVIVINIKQHNQGAVILGSIIYIVFFNKAQTVKEFFYILFYTLCMAIGGEWLMLLLQSQFLSGDNAVGAGMALTILFIPALMFGLTGLAFYTDHNRRKMSGATLEAGSVSSAKKIIPVNHSN